MSKRPAHTSTKEQWLQHVIQLRGAENVVSVQKALELYDNDTALPIDKGIGIADILLTLELDNDTLAASLVYPLLQVKHLTTETLTEKFGDSSAKLLHDVLQMQTLGQSLQAHTDQQHIENLRKMLLAMVIDVRSILFVLAERLWELHQAKLMEPVARKKMAQETFDVYAPLANRIGLWQLKWEMEDLCLRYLQPDVYEQTAKWLAFKRVEREAFIKEAITTLNTVLMQAHISNFQVSGRVKHIYSIYAKMQRKNTSFEKIYDISALRVLVPSVADCYAVLSELQTHWQQIPEEFDDYISQPKPNGYRSIHTVIIHDENRFIEVQIRTYQMHQESELGVAAHWQYKEGVLQTSGYEAKIALLRQVMAWQKDVSPTEQTIDGQKQQDLFADRVYVFTPTGDIIDLPNGATPLDFAYHIHSEVGHRCRGAKVDGHIVPLTYHLQTGDRVEILTAKEANPSRDWLNPHHGCLNTARARAKVQHWFRVKDSQQRAITGREWLEKEFKKNGLSDKTDLHAVVVKLHYKTTDDMLAALGAGELRMSQIMQHLQPVHAPQAPPHIPQVMPRDQSTHPNVHILGIGNLLTHIASCCKPLPGDQVIGYVTRTRGVTVHRHDCSNLPNMMEENTSRLIEVHWNNQPQNQAYPTDLVLRLTDRTGLLRDLTTLLATEKINILGLQALPGKDKNIATIYLTIEISSKEQLKKALELLHSMPDLIDVRRR